MRRSTDLTNRHRRGTRDLFGKRQLASATAETHSLGIALELRAMSERAFHAGLGRSSSLIEIAALMVELEGAALAQDELEA